MLGVLAEYDRGRMRAWARGLPASTSPAASGSHDGQQTPVIEMITRKRRAQGANPAGGGVGTRSGEKRWIAWRMA
jgi:hypothetical protein